MGSARLVYGVKPVLEAVRAHPERIEHLYLVSGQLAGSPAAEILSRAREAGLRVHQVDRKRLAAMVAGALHQGVVAELREFRYAELPELLEAARASGAAPLLVLLDGIQDPQNLGAIIRSAHALGAHGVVLPKDRAAGVSGAVAKSSAGAIEHCPVARVVNLSRAIEELKEAGLWVCATTVAAEQPPWEAKLSGPLAVVIGSEEAGVREGVLKHCDFTVRIPMLGKVGSLNASVAAGIFLYEVSRQRASGSSRPA